MFGGHGVRIHLMFWLFLADNSKGFVLSVSLSLAAGGGIGGHEVRVRLMFRLLLAHVLVCRFLLPLVTVGGAEGTWCILHTAPHGKSLSLYLTSIPCLVES